MEILQEKPALYNVSHKIVPYLSMVNHNLIKQVKMKNHDVIHVIVLCWIWHHKNLSNWVKITWQE